jgi:hypothetical protein
LFLPKAKKHGANGGPERENKDKQNRTRWI